MPGIKANACANPTFSASGQRMSSMLSMRTVSGLRFCRRSAHRITKAPTMKAVATGTGAKSRALIALAKASPSIAAGRKATNKLSTKRCAARSRKSPAATAISFTRYSQHTARIAPA